MINFLVRISDQKDSDGPYVLGDYNLISVNGHGIEIGPDERFNQHTGPSEEDAATKVLTDVIMTVAAANPALGQMATVERDGQTIVAPRRWKMEYWTGWGIRDGKPARDPEGRIAGPDAVIYFVGPPADGGFDWPAFQAVVETWREASDNRDLAEWTMVAAIRQALNGNAASVAQLAKRVGWSPEYTRLVGRGERLPVQTAPVTTYDKADLAEMGVTGTHGNTGEDPDKLIAQAMALLAQAREILKNRG